jgi:hypothetical protein
MLLFSDFMLLMMAMGEGGCSIEVLFNFSCHIIVSDEISCVARALGGPATPIMAIFCCPQFMLLLLLGYPERLGHWVCLSLQYLHL